MRDGTVALAQDRGHVGVGQAVEAIAPQSALPRIPGQRQHLLDHWQGVVEAGVEAGDLGDVRALAQQDLDGLQRERLVQRRQRDVALEVGQHLGIDAHRVEVLATAVDHAVRDRGHAAPVEPGQDALPDQRQRVAVGVVRAQFDRERRHVGLAEIRRRPADALHLAVPQRPARQRHGAGIEHGELDARRAAVEHQQDVSGGFGHGYAACVQAAV